MIVAAVGPLGTLSQRRFGLESLVSQKYILGNWKSVAKVSRPANDVCSRIRQDSERNDNPATGDPYPPMGCVAGVWRDRLVGLG